MNDSAAIRQSAKTALFMAYIMGFASVFIAILYMWKHSMDLWAVCLFPVGSVISFVVYRKRRRHLKGLGSN
jgi:hypothetical protein